MGGQKYGEWAVVTGATDGIGEVKSDAPGHNACGLSVDNVRLRFVYNSEWALCQRRIEAHLPLHAPHHRHMRMSSLAGDSTLF